MKRFAATLLATALSNVFATETGFYVQGSSGINLLGDSTTKTGAYQISYEPGLLAALEMGLIADQSNNFRWRFGQEVLYTNNALKKNLLGGLPKISDGDLSIYGGMFNAYVDLLPNSLFSPYIGGGLGLGIIELQLNNSPSSQDDSSLLYQIKAGATLRPLPNVAFFAGYRYLNIDQLNDELAGLASPRFHVGELGVRFIFM